ncbi:restriction endonuclease subunit S [Listeria monocytogenes]|nr:restriction endonuclease subunit S [Listeria monocytogenes]
MKKLEKSVPVIRFKGFSEAWEQRKLGEVFTERSEKSSKGELISVTISSGVIKASELERKDISSSDKSNYKVVKKGDIAYNSMRMWQGASGHSLFDGILSPAYTIITPKKNISSKFISYIFKKHNMIQNFQRRSQGLTSDTWNLKFPALSGIKVKIPNYTEQAKISDFFQHIDNTIALHQRKLDALKLMKKGFLQQMFPKSEEDVPKIRFTDFNGNWRQRKLEEVADRVRGNDRRMELPTLTISASKGWLNQHDRFFGNIAGKEQKNYTLLKKGQLSYNHGNSKSAKYGAVFVLRTYDEALVPRIYHSFKTNILANSDFIEYLFATKIPDRELRKIVSSGARMDGLLNINFNDFMSILIMLPFVEEQIKISNSLIRLDKIISLYQNKLDQLIKLKKAYLQYLFI